MVATCIYYTSCIHNNIIEALVIFKYSDFFIESFSSMVTLFGKRISVKSVNLLLPIGISFYIFQSFTYTIDIY
jgi:alginate O-acetyltransferase complex protein AlgI